MIITYPALSAVFDTDIHKVNTLIVENPEFLRSLISDISGQLDGGTGNFAVSENGKILKTDKSVELLSQFFPFELNKKTLINKITEELESRALNGENYNDSIQIVSDFERLLYSLSVDFSCEIAYNKLDIGSLIKASGISINSNGDSLAEQITDYMELVTEFEKNKLFVTLNLRSFISDAEAALFMDTVISHGYRLFMIESRERQHLEKEKRYIIDSDLCEIS